MDILGSLPTEVSLAILEYLEAGDLGRACRVSRHWRHLANTDSLWRKLCSREGLALISPSSSSPVSLTSSIQVGRLDQVCPWAEAFSSYCQRQTRNWRQNRKVVHVIATVDTAVLAVHDTVLAYSDDPGAVFIYELALKTRFVQTIDLEIEDPVLSLGLTKSHLVVKQGDAFTIFSKHSKTCHNFVLEGFLVPFDGTYVFTKHNHPAEIAFIRYAVIEGAVCVLYESSLFVYSLKKSYMHTFKVESLSFLLHDNYRVYVGTGRHTVTGIDSNGSYIDLDLVPSSIVSIKSNKDIIVALVCAEYLSGRFYIFKVWSRRCPYSEFHTSRPFGLQVASYGSRFASVANDKFGQRVFVSIYDIDKKSKDDIDLDCSEPIAQAKVYFINRELLYVVTRKDWGAYDTGYLLDLRAMYTLYQGELDHMGIVSVDSKLAVYLNTEEIEIHYYNRYGFSQCL